jgi:glycine reductase
VCSSDLVTCGKIVGFQEGIIDMAGDAAEYTPFSRTFNLVLIFQPVDGIEIYQYEEACRVAGLKTAIYLARKAHEAGAGADNVETYELPSMTQSFNAYPGLPKVAYLYMLQSQGLLHDTYVYGLDAKRLISTIMHPNETMDGAITSGNCVSACDKNSTFVHQNNPVIKALYARHGVDLNFAGIIITNENVTLIDKRRSSAYAIKLATMLGIEGLVISEEGFGNPDADLILNCRRAENAGIRTVLITDEFAGRDGASQSLADAAKEADAVVSSGNANMMIELPVMERVIGYDDYVETIAGGFSGSLRADKSILVELQAITGATCELGFNRMGGKTL